MRRAAFLLLTLVPLVTSAAPDGCEHQLTPITISDEDMLGKWLYIGGSSDIPGSRSLAYLMSSVWLNITATSQSNVLRILQTQRISGKCSSLIYDVKFENSSMLIEEPFYLKEVYLPTDCSDCLLVYEDVASGGDTFSSLLLFSRRRNVSDAAMDDLKGKAECLGMPSPIMVDAKSDLCPEDVPPSEGLSALNSIFEAKMGHHVARLLDALFDALVN
ncbi:uncharacterized protein LOC130527979 [Takifugu flavidus]|uniref:uncharacterized protein LOC130527979 n=1 Tax=Takifugu flavidus TaxID=433684 RepID=UPI00254469AC|nr:uncharacterized protein LOC130527979 [Takifugu flavidus]